MNKNFVFIAAIFSVIFSLFITSAEASAGVFTAFGPKTFKRETGKPVTETASFSVKNPDTVYTLHVYNGGMNSEFSQASSAIVQINGSVIFGPSDFNQQTGHVQKQVPVAEKNVLKVELRSAPGSGLTIVLEGTDDVPPVATISSPSDGDYLNTPSITVTGSAIDSISYVSAVSVNGTAATLNNDTFSSSIALTEGANTITVQAIDAADNTAQSAVTVVLDTTAPELSVTSPLNQSIMNTETVSVTGTITDAGSGVQTVSVNGVMAAISANTYTASALPLTEGLNTITITAHDNAGNAASMTSTVYRDTAAPVVTITSPADGSVTTEATVMVTGSVSEAVASVLVNSAAATVSDLTFSLNLDLTNGANTITVTATDPAGNEGSAAITVNYTALVGIPPDPAMVAPALDDTVATTIAAATAFLYTGEDPIQTGVAPGTIEPRRAAVLRGKALDIDGVGLPGVMITILDHPEFGSTKTRMDGMFDMAVNGGGQLIVRYERDGFISVQRQVEAPWQDYAWAAEVVMIAFDEKVTTVDLSAPVPIQVAQGSTITDDDGARTATLLFQQGTNALMWLPGGTYETLTTLNVRATEFTVGENGPKAMPAALPPSSAYTYAVEFSVDEAVAAGATSVSFSRPVISYTDNFLDFPVGTGVPAGYYNRQYGVWVPMDDGRVIKILKIEGGIAELDVDGSGTAASASALSGLGITDEERKTLASLYEPDKSIWRVAINHFSIVDYNWSWAYTNPDDATGPDAPDPEQTGSGNPPGGCPGGGNGGSSPGDCPKQASSQSSPCTQPGSIIECENQNLGESIAVTGTPFTLNYRSDRSPGRKAAYRLKIPLSGVNAPGSLQHVTLAVHVAGRSFNYKFENALQSYDFVWDGKDAYGRTVQGAQPVTINIGYAYEAVFIPPAAVLKQRSFGKPVTTGRGPRPARILIYKSQQKQTVIGPMDSRSLGLGGWSFDIQHAYDQYAQTLFLGDGRRRSTKDIGKVITTVAGNVAGGCADTGGPAGLAIDDRGNLRAGCSGIATDRQGNLYLAVPTTNRIWKIYPDGTYGVVAGTWGSGYSGDGGPATYAQLSYPRGVAIDHTGNIYIADASNNRVRKIAPDGIITTVAGNGIDYCMSLSGDGGPAVAAHVCSPWDVATDSRGNLYIAERWSNAVRKTGPDGIITTVAGYGPPGYSGDGGPARWAQLDFPRGVTVDAQGNVYIADSGNHRIRKVTPDGIITTVAGTGIAGYSGDGGPAINAKIYAPHDVAVDSQGNLFIADTYNRVIRKVSSPLPGFSGQDIAIPSEDGAELYQFNAEGKQLRTIDTLTGVVKYSFTYDAAGQLISVTDKDGNTTTIERDAAGNPTAIIAPGGQRTTLSIDANGYLTGVANPAGETTVLEHTSEGLLTAFTTPEGNVHAFAYDDHGLLVKDDDPAGGFKSLSRTGSGNDYTVHITTALGRTTAYRVEKTATGTRRTVTGPAGLQSVTAINENGTTTTTMPDGTTTTETQTPDPRFGMQAPVTGSSTVTTPGGLTATSTTSRTVSLTDSKNPLSLTSLTETTTINGKTYTSTYNKSANTITTTTPAGRTRTAKLDSKGRVIEEQIPEIDPLNYSYDEKGRLTTITQGGRTTTINYDSLNQISSIMAPLSRSVGFSYDPAGRVTQQTLPGDRTVTFAFDDDGNLTALTPPGRPEHGFTYTTVDLLKDYLPPSIGAGTVSTTYSYDVDRNLTQINRPDGRNVALDYDSAGRISTFTTAQGAVSYSYNPSSGNLAAISANGESISYSFDGSLLTSISFAGTVGGSVSFGYNNDFRITSETINNGNAVAYAYDNDGLLTGAGSLALTRNTQNGLLTGTTLGSVTTGYNYNSLGEVELISAGVSGGEIYRVSYSRDSLSRITQKTETIGGVTDTYAYGYDTAGRLTSVAKNNVTAGSYAYDSNGNRISYAGQNGTAAGTYDNQDRVITYGVHAYTYTANGDLSSKTTNGQTTAYSYDALGNLLSISLPDNTVIEYVIDGQNRRIGKKVNGSLVQGFLYQNQLRPVAELNGSGAIVSRFVYATKANVPDYMIKGGVTYRIITDHLGSPRLVVDSTTGVIAQRMDYDEFGNITLDTNPGFQPFGFAGGLYDQHTKVVRFGLRDYDAVTGRWTAKDPILFAGGDTNLFGYVGNNPVNFVDPLGLELKEIGTRPGPNGQPVLIVLDTETGQTSSGYPGSYMDPLTSITRDALKTTGENIDKVLNNPVTDALDAIPPGQSVGHPAADVVLNALQLMKGYWNEIKKACQ